MNFIEIKANKRALGSKGYLKDLRRDGKIPGVLHGQQQASIPLYLDSPDLRRALNTPAGRNVLLKLILDDETQTAMIENLQEDIVRDDVYLHIDLKLISMDEAIEVQVPILLHGQDLRESDDGFVSQQLHELTLMSKPAAIPESIRVDVSGLLIGDGLVVGDITMPEGCEAITPADEMIVTVLAPKALEEEEEEDAEALDEDAAAVPEPERVGESSEEA